MRQAPRHFTPGLRPLRRHDFRNIVKHQQALLTGQFGTPRHQGNHVLGRAPALRPTDTTELKRLLPMVQRVFTVGAEKVVELRLHLLPKGLQPVNLGQCLPLVRGQWHPQYTGGTGIGRKDVPVGIEHHDAGREVVQNGLQVGVRRAHLCHAGLHRLARVGKLLGHLGK